MAKGISWPFWHGYSVCQLVTSTTTTTVTVVLRQFANSLVWLLKQKTYQFFMHTRMAFKVAWGRLFLLVWF